MAVELLNIDCMEYMAGLSNNSFDLACVDPPYGIGAAKQLYKGTSNDVIIKHKTKNWDNSKPPKEYFTELFRISINQIVWGGNYFINNLESSRCFLVWDKQNGNNSMADAELAWTNFDKPVRMYRGHIFSGIGCINYITIHPTQKPIALYSWIFQNYAKPGQSVIDTHLGSGSSAIAAHYAGIDFVGCEIDKDYFDAACKRYKEETRQLKLF